MVSLAMVCSTSYPNRRACKVGALLAAVVVSANALFIPRPSMHRARRPIGSFGRLAASSSNDVAAVDVNALMTQLNDAVASEDYMKAAALKKKLDALQATSRADSGTSGDLLSRGQQADWFTLGCAPWLADRLTDLGFRFATPCQAYTLKALLKVVIASGVEADGTPVDSSRLEEEWRDIALRVATGSGKTLAYLSSALTSVSRELYNREKVIFDAVVESVEASEAAAAAGSPNDEAAAYAELDGEEGSDTTDLSRKMAFALSPSLVMAELGSGAQVWLRQPEAAQRQPLVMVLCPSRELCAQVAMQLHQLVGGNVRQDYAPSDKLSVFNYRGPRGMRICGLLDAQDATLGLDLTSPAGGHLRWCDVVVATPAAAGTLYATEASYFDDLRVVVVDEADLVLDALDANMLPQAAPLAALLTSRDLSDRSFLSRRAQPRHMLVGATLGESQLAKAAQAGVLDHGPDRYVPTVANSDPVPVTATSSGLPGGIACGGTVLVTGRGMEAPMKLGLDSSMTASMAAVGANDNGDSSTRRTSSSSGDGGTFEAPTVPSGLVHRVASVEKWQQRAALVRLIRRDLDAWESKREQEDEVDTSGSGSDNSDGSHRRPRVVIFTKNDAEAKAVAPVLRNALWGRHKIYALLPEEGAMPLQVLEQFAGAASASLEARSKERQNMEVKTPSSNGKGDNGDVNVWGANTAPTVLLTTPVAARGLDFTNLTHVYSLDVLSGLSSSSAEVKTNEGSSLGAFMDAKAEYAHQAGRLGRLGNRGTGIVTSIVAPDYATSMRNLVLDVAGANCQLEEVKPAEYEVLAEERGLDEDVSGGAGSESDDAATQKAARAKQVQALTDLFELYDVEEPNIEGKKE